MSGFEDFGGGGDGLGDEDDAPAWQPNFAAPKASQQPAQKPALGLNLSPNPSASNPKFQPFNQPKQNPQLHQQPPQSQQPQQLQQPQQPQHQSHSVGGGFTGTITGALAAGGAVAGAALAGSGSPSSGGKRFHKPREWVVESNQDYMAETLQDYKTVEETMEKWKLINCYRPFRKNVVSLIGTISSGKSSFVNFFFGLFVKSVTLAQQDSHWTLVEVVDEEEFRNYVGPSYRRVKLSQADIMGHGDDDEKRKNRLITVLDETSTFARYQQFNSFAETFQKNKLVTTILINGLYLDYLQGASPKVNRRRRNTILIDSPGFGHEERMDDIEENLAVLQYFYSLSHLTLFFIPANEINSISTQIKVFELSVLYAKHGNEKIQKIVKAKNQPSNQAEKGGSWFPSIQDMLIGFADAIQKDLFSDAEHDRGIVKSTSYYDNIRFVMTKIDLVRSRKDDVSLSTTGSSSSPSSSSSLSSFSAVPDLSAQWFEFGCLLARSLTVLPTPVFSQCRSISLRLIQPPDRNPHYCPDLGRVITEISSLDFYDSYKKRMETSIQKMCRDLLLTFEKSYSSYFSWDKDNIQKILKASQSRSRAPAVMS